MHGRLKIKTTAEQAAEKQKEREGKRKLYLGGVTKAFEKRSSGTHDEEGLKITAQLLAANPDAATLWNFRREILLALKGDDESWEKLLTGELAMVESCLMKNHKSYGAWHHRFWVMMNFPKPPWKAELSLCDKYLKLDERNCELYFFLVFHELQTVVEAVFTDPSDQSPWFFLRWLVNRQEKVPRMLQVGYVRYKGDSGLVICVFSQPVPQRAVPFIRLNGADSDETLIWYAPNDEDYSNVWVAELNLSSVEAHTISLIIDPSMTEMLNVGEGSTQAIEWVTTLEVGGEELSDTARSTLEEVKDNCVTLDELDPGNKWVLLTLVDVMWALDCHTHQKKIHSYLSQLQELDVLRNKYYADMKSKLAMETSLKQYRIVAEVGSKFELSGHSLTRITLSHLLASTASIDLSRNDLTSISPLSNLVACRKLILDDNQIQNLAPLAGLKALESLSLTHNKIQSLEQLKVLEGLSALTELNILPFQSVKCFLDVERLKLHLHKNLIT
ncbi:Geranylgeranyl transferase type-2 subunit alpha-like [Homarus americanus]|uniref:Geranylgeranyl transferase type-2 subunit alpha n=1 Tax=Homarus americanus TaxID=6706 RepID=A0A8J5N2R7_HOMAM|nr:Geranylgeranyl transferase type-2 subunit alpha-like [Homarus americanus]